MDKSSRIVQSKPIGALRPMTLHTIHLKNTLRLYQCARCFEQVKICTHCDRGNIYCTKGCARIARKAAHLAAAIRYQMTRLGKLNHALCQKRYRANLRLKNKVIDQGSLVNPPPLPFTPLNAAHPSAPKSQFSCDFCGKKANDSTRRGFLNGSRRFAGYVLRTSMAFGP
jgi:hypothetical protein